MNEMDSLFAGYQTVFILAFAFGIVSTFLFQRIDEPPASEKSLRQVRANIMKSGQVGNLVANDFRSTIILAPLMETHPETGEPLNFGSISEQLEELVRDKYENDTIKIHMTIAFTGCCSSASVFSMKIAQSRSAFSAGTSSPELSVNSSGVKALSTAWP